MTTVVSGKLEADSDDTYIDTQTRLVLGEVNELLCDGFAGKAGVLLGELLDLLDIIESIHESEDREVLNDYDE